jgi:hypothetical protein
MAAAVRPLPTIAGGTGGAGLGGVALSSSTYNAVPRAILDGIELRAERGLLDSIDERAENRSVTREVTFTRGFRGRDKTTVEWRGYLLNNGVTPNGERGRVLFIEPSLDSGKRQLLALFEASRMDGAVNAKSRALEWSVANLNTLNQYRAAIRDARGQAMANAAAAAAFDEAFETPEERAEAQREAEREKRMAKVRAAKIAERYRTGDSREARAYQARIARISENSALTGLYARLLDEGRDVEEAAAELVPEAEAEPVSALDRLYPLEDAAYYLDTFAELPLGWGELYLGLIDEADVPLQPDQYYIETFATIPQPWQNLYRQAMTSL